MANFLIPKAPSKGRNSTPKIHYPFLLETLKYIEDPYWVKVVHDIAIKKNPTIVYRKEAFLLKKDSRPNKKTPARQFRFTQQTWDECSDRKYLTETFLKFLTDCGLSEKIASDSSVPSDGAAEEFHRGWKEISRVVRPSLIHDFVFRALQKSWALNLRQCEYILSQINTLLNTGQINDGNVIMHGGYIHAIKGINLHPETKQIFFDVANCESHDLTDIIEEEDGDDLIASITTTITMTTESEETSTTYT